MNIELQVRDGLTAPVSYWQAPGEIRERNCNGCGTEGWLGALVPDTIWGLPITAACDIHDWHYCVGETDEDKAQADFIFQQNLVAMIRRSAARSLIGWLLKIPREYRAFSYYMVVTHSDAGAEAFREARVT